MQSSARLVGDEAVRGQVPLSRSLEERMASWLKHRGHAADIDAGMLRMRDLAASIRSQCIELMHLADRARDGSTAVERKV